MGDKRTKVEDLPDHLRPPYDDVVASHTGPEGILWELEDGRYISVSCMLLFAEKHERSPDEQEWNELVEDYAAETKEGAREVVSDG